MERTIKGKPSEVLTPRSLERLGIEMDEEISVTVNVEATKKRTMKEIMGSASRDFKANGGTRELIDEVLAEENDISSQKDG